MKLIKELAKKVLINIVCAIIGITIIPIMWAIVFGFVWLVLP